RSDRDWSSDVCSSDLEVIDEEAAAIHHVGKALDAAVVVLDSPGGGQELVLAHDDALAGLKMDRCHVTWRVTAESDLAGGLRLDQDRKSTRLNSSHDQI